MRVSGAFCSFGRQAWLGCLEEEASRSLDPGANEGGQQDWCDRHRKTGKLTPQVGPG